MEFERQPSVEGLRKLADERAETIERLAKAIRKMNGDVTHAIAEHVRDPRRAT